MIRILNLLMAGFIYLCVGTVVFLSIGVVWLISQGLFAQERWMPALAALHGVDPYAAAKEAAAAAKKGVESPSPDQLAQLRFARDLDRDLRDQALAKALLELRNLQAAVRTERARFDQQYESFRSELDGLRKRVTDTSVQEVQQTLESLDPKQSKDQMLRILEDKDLPPEQGLQRVVAIIKGMPIDKRKKILSEFKSELESKWLATLLKQIGDGVPETALLDDASRRLDELKPRKK